MGYHLTTRGGADGIEPYGLIDSHRCNWPVLAVGAGMCHAPPVAFISAPLSNHATARTKPNDSDRVRPPAHP